MKQWAKKILIIKINKTKICCFQNCTFLKDNNIYRPRITASLCRLTLVNRSSTQGVVTGRLKTRTCNCQVAVTHTVYNNGLSSLNSCVYEYTCTKQRKQRTNGNRKITTSSVLLDPARGIRAMRSKLSTFFLVQGLPSSSTSKCPTIRPAFRSPVII